MNPWECVGLSASLMLMIFSATIIGMVRHNVLQNPETCCVKDSSCEETLSSQHMSYYDVIAGLRTRYIIAVVMFLFVAILRTTSIPYHLDFSLSDNVMIFLALVTYAVFVLFADTSLHSFSSSPDTLLPQCSEISTLITSSVRVLSVFLLMVTTLLFYLFLISLPGRNEKNVIVYNSLGKRGTQNTAIDDEFGEDDDGEDIVFHTARV